MKKLSNLLICFSCILFLGACSDDDEKNILQGTKWRFEGYIPTENAELIVLESSTKCEICYVLNFGEDSTWNTFGYYNMKGGIVEIKKDRITFNTQVESLVDGSNIIEENVSEEYQYFDLLSKVNRYRITGKKLHLHSENQSSYLIYKMVQ